MPAAITPHTARVALPVVSPPARWCHFTPHPRCSAPTAARRVLHAHKNTARVAPDVLKGARKAHYTASFNILSSCLHLQCHLCHCHCHFPSPTSAPCPCLPWAGQREDGEGRSRAAPDFLNSPRLAADGASACYHSRTLPGAATYLLLPHHLL